MSVEIEELTELVEGSSVFKANGFSYVKVVRNGKPIGLKIPIKSSGVSELIDEMNKTVPQPPAKKAFISPDEELGKEMGLRKKEAMYLPDYADSEYIKAKDKHDRDLGLMIVLQGLNMAIKDGEGKEITDPERKIGVLKGMGLSGQQFTQLVNDITSLTKWEDEKETSFLPS